MSPRDVRRSTACVDAATVGGVSSPLSFPIDVVYEDAGDGWVMASVPQVPGSFSQGRSREEARENVRDALRELLLARADETAAHDGARLAAEQISPGSVSGRRQP